ncbi:MAG: SURF1 family protein [Proteobacteria bacterium]|nr:SURF1 family protein [Pseudomonadota bacterium]
MLIVLIALGTWQVQRLQWKNELIENRSARITVSPIAPTAIEGARFATADDSALRSLEYMPVVLEGRYLDAPSLRLQPRVLDGKAGVHVVSLLEAKPFPAPVLVDRGWAPLGVADADTRPPTGSVRVAGYVRLFAAPGMFVPDNEPAANVWFVMDEVEMREAFDAPAPPILKFYIQAAPGNNQDASYPLGLVPDVNLRNSHLEYAVTWYAFALVFLVIFVLFHWNRKET